MFDFLRKKSRSAGSVLFPGTLPPRIENFDYLTGKGFTLEPCRAEPDYAWAARLSHPEWGEADLKCPRETVALPRQLLELERRLDESEVDAVASSGCSVQVEMCHERENVLRERKLALRILHALMGDDGVASVDHGSMRIWSRPALEEELAHDALLDIESLFNLHAVHDDKRDENGEPHVYWLHSHGLGELGYFDFDILDPSRPVVDGSGDLTRALAYSIVLGAVAADGDNLVLTAPDGEVRLVSAYIFMRDASDQFRRLRDDTEAHSLNRCVVCEPAKRRFFGLLGGGGKVEPSRWLRRPLPDNPLILFTTEATNLISQRAVGSYPVFRKHAAEFAEFEVHSLAKIGIATDSGGPDDREHVWFEIKEMGDDTITGVLINQPWDISALQEGETYTYPIEVMSDWTIFTPAGRITPVEAMAARILRSQREEILKNMDK